MSWAFSIISDTAPRSRATPHPPSALDGYRDLISNRGKKVTIALTVDSRIFVMAERPKRQ